MEETFARHTVQEILALIRDITHIPRDATRNRRNLTQFLSTLPDETRGQLIATAGVKTGSKRRAPQTGTRPRKRPRLSSRDSSPSDEGESQGHLNETMALTENHIEDTFLETVDEQTIHECISRTIDRTSNNALRKETCMVCARSLFLHELELCHPSDIPNRAQLLPTHPHSAQTLFNGILLHAEAVARSETFLCTQCKTQLKKWEIPALSLANNMWIGRTPKVLADLTLPERLLVALYFPAAYIIKLYPKAGPGKSQAQDRLSLNSGLKGNVTTYRLNTTQIARMVQGKLMPQHPHLLAATIGVTFVGPNNVPLSILPRFLHVRRQNVIDALLWLKEYNELYKDIEISEERSSMLPEDSIPDSILSTTRYVVDTGSTNAESADYVPEDNGSESEAEEAEERTSVPVADASINEIGFPAAQYCRRQAAAVKLLEDKLIAKPDVIPLQANGVIDVYGETVTDEDLFVHAAENILPANIRKEYGVRRGSAFVNEYARVDDMGERFDGGPGNPNHLLGAFPVLFPYGRGGFEVDREKKVTYEAHIKWALQYEDMRFRKDLYLIFQAFGVLQKRQICRSAALQIKRSVFLSNQETFSKLQPKDFYIASAEEIQHLPISNPIMQSLRKQITTVRARVMGTDESRIAIRAQVWGMTLRFNAPTIWATINLSDTGDPVAQVLAGREIDLDSFIATAGPNAVERSHTIASDPYAAAEFFHFTIRVLLEEMFGIHALHGRIKRKKGILGVVNGYIGTVEAQARGTLHLHILFWLEGALTGNEMRHALKKESFRDRMRRFIDQNIKADIDGATAATILSLKRSHNVAYSRPVDPRLPDYQDIAHEAETRIARTVQVHNCHVKSCLKTRNGVLVCKRRAPWPTANEAWVDEGGNWGPKRLYSRVNAWNPPLMQATRCNQDMKIITNGADTKDITFYITLYIAKRQIQAANASAILAKSIAFHKQRMSNDTEHQEANKQLLQRCANTLSRQHEFSAPEVISYLMGWGDRLISHAFVKILWDQVTCSIRESLPETQIQQPAAYPPALTDQNSTSNTTGINMEPNSTLILDRGSFTLKDQLKEYADRGTNLESMNFYDYFVDTYHSPRPYLEEDKDDEDEHEIEHNEPPPALPSRKRGRPRHRREPYLPNCQRKGCRVFQTKDAETNLHIVGRWFPRSTDDNKEYYSAQILVLLLPWRKIEDVKGNFGTLAESLAAFLQRATPKVRKIVENIQYFYDCSDSALRERPFPVAGNGFTPVPDNILAAAEEADSLQEESGSTRHEEDIRRNRRAAEARAYGERAMEVAYNNNIFQRAALATCMLPHVRTATEDEKTKYDSWSKKVEAISRKQPQHTAMQVDAPDETTVLDEYSPRRAPAPCDSSATVLEMGSQPQRRPTEQHWVKRLNMEQRRAHDIIHSHCIKTKNGMDPDQLLMIVRGEGGTGKTVLINALCSTFEHEECAEWLAKTGTTGVAASLIEGQTIHSWAAIPVRQKGEGKGAHGNVKQVTARRKKNILPVLYLFIDEFSMLTKHVLAQLSQIMGAVKAASGKGTPSKAFGGVNVIIFGDPHQFPPVGNRTAAVFCEGHNDDFLSMLGLSIYQQFDTVVTLTEQRRVSDPEWMTMLQRLRIGDCTDEDKAMIRGLKLTNPSCEVPNWTEAPWNDVVLITPRHESRIRWNSAAVLKYAQSTGNPLYISQAEDGIGPTSRPLTRDEKAVVAAAEGKNTGKLSKTVELAVGMRAMVVLNISTEADLANGTRGNIVDIRLDPREPPPAADCETGAFPLKYPPAVILFKPDHRTSPPFEDLPAGVLPITPTTKTFTVTYKDGNRLSIRRRQLAVTPAYAFTDYKSQGQTLAHVLVDLQTPSNGGLTPFNAYVALSRSHGRANIRILRDYDDKLFSKHPWEKLKYEDERLDALTEATMAKHASNT